MSVGPLGVPRRCLWVLPSGTGSRRLCGPYVWDPFEEREGLESQGERLCVSVQRDPTTAALLREDRPRRNEDGPSKDEGSKIGRAVEETLQERPQKL